MNVEKRSVAALRPHPKNYRRHGDAQMKVLRDSLRLHGLQKPVVIQADGTILAGHALVEAAKAEGWDAIECHVYDGPPEYAEAFLVADNRTNELAENDWSALADLLQELDAGALDMLATGYDAAALMELMHGCDEASARIMENEGRPPQTGASPWDRMGGSTDRVAFQFGALTASLSKDQYEGFAARVKSYGEQLSSADAISKALGLSNAT